MARQRLAHAAEMVALATAYVLAARVGLMMDAVAGFATLVWPPTGIALAALLLRGYRLWPAVFIGAFAANVWASAPVLVALGIGVGNTLEAVVGAYALRRIPGFRNSLARVRDVLGLMVVAAALSTTISATIGVASLYLGGMVPLANVGETWRAWWVGDLISDLLVAPVLLVWASRPRAPRDTRRLLEAAALGLSVAAVSFLIFGRTAAQDGGGFGQAYMVFPLLIWAALRFGQRGAVSTAFIVSLIAVLGTALGRGPFVRPALYQSLFALETFMGVAGATFLVLGASVSERRRAVEALKAAVSERRDRGEKLARLNVALEVSNEQLRTQTMELEAQTESLQSTTDELTRQTAAREDALQAAERAAARIAALQRATAALSTAATPSEVVRVVLEEGVSALGAFAGTLSMVSDDGQDLETTAAIGFDAAVLAEWRRYPLTSPTPASDAVRTCEAQVLETRADWAARYPHLGPSREVTGVEASIALPLLAGGRADGAMSLHFREARTFDQEERSFMLALAGEASQVLERARLFEAARAAEERLRLAQRSARIGTFDWHIPSGRVVWTEEEERVFGLEPGTFDGTLEGWARHVLPEDLASTRAAIADCLARREREMDFAFRIRWPDESVHTIEGSAMFLYAEDGTPLRMVGVNIDVTDRKRAEAEREHLLEAEREARAEADATRQRAEAANRAKSEFLAVMSHELRTPLNAIAGYVQLLEMGLHGPLSDAQHETLERVDRSQRHLLRLINDVLNFARIESGRIEYEITEVPLAEALADLAALIQPQLADKRLSHDVRVAPELLVRADRDKLRQILVNLLSNAVKFTPAGGRVVVEALERSRIPDVVFIRVADSGRGIPRDKLEHIFEPFVQVDASHTRTTDGVGLGLAISRDLARGMGGDLRARSIEGEGSAFTLSLPKA